MVRRRAAEEGLGAKGAKAGALIRPLKITYEWLPLQALLRGLEIPEERVRSVRDKEEEEHLIMAIKSDPEGFFDRSPILLTTHDGEKLYLADGQGRLEIAKQLNVARLKARIEYYRSERDAYDAALDASYNVNAARGRVTPYDKVRYANLLKSRGLSAAQVAARMNISEKMVYHLWKIYESDDLMRRLKAGEISLREAVLIAYKPSAARSLTRETGEGRPSRRPAATTASRVAAALRPGAAEGERRELGRADVLREVKKGLEALGIADKRDERALLREAERVFAEVDPALAMRAVRIWRDSGGALTYTEALEKAKEMGGEAPEERKMEETLRCPQCGEILRCPRCSWPGGVEGR